jgi:hypothetical protein
MHLNDRWDGKGNKVTSSSDASDQHTQNVHKIIQFSLLPLSTALARSPIVSVSITQPFLSV